MEHAAFVAIPGGLVESPVRFRGEAEIGTAAGNDVIGRGGNVIAERVFAGDECAQRLVERGRGIAFVAAAPEQKARVVADAQQQVLCVVHEHLLIGRVRSVGGIGQPEILPDQNAVAVGGFIEFFVADHADPVSHQIEVFVAVQLHGTLIVGCAIPEIAFTEPPVSTTAHQSAAIDPDAERPVGRVVIETADAGIESGLIAVAGTHRHGIEVRFSISVGPPEFRLVDGDPGGYGEGCAGGNPDLLAERDVTEASFPQGLYREIRVVDQGCAQDDAYLGGVEDGRKAFQGREYGRDGGVEDADGAMSFQPDVVPYAGVASADRGDPVPADGGVESGVVGAQDAAIRRAAFLRVGFGHAGMCRRIDRHFQHVVGRQQMCDVERGVGEGAFDPPDETAVERDVGFPVDAVEMQFQALVLNARTIALRQSETGTVDKRREEVGVADILLIVTKIRIGEHLAVQITGKHGTGNCSGNPGGGFIGLRLTCHQPVPIEVDAPVGMAV